MTLKCQEANKLTSSGRRGCHFIQGMFIYKNGLLSNMSRSIQTGSSISRKSHHIRSAIKPKRIADVVGLRILGDEDWKETRAELKKINKDTLDRLEKSY